MISRIPDFEPSFALLQKRAEPLFSIDLHVVTPLFGGSATPRQPDPNQPVAGKSVRGHLRFWWRACFAPKYLSAAALYDAESVLWGNTDAPSSVDIHIDTVSGGKELPAARFEPGKMFSTINPNYPKYALFPFQGKANRNGVEEEPSNALEGVMFHLHIVEGRAGGINDQQKAEIEAALWAWILFGGVGSRTRRGCGSLWSPDTRFQFASQSFNAVAARHIAVGACAYGVPVLSKSRLIFAKPENRSPIQEWKEAIDCYAYFRQGPDFGRNVGQQPNRPGRSRWPEADSLRQRAGRWDRQHEPLEPARPYYPRADLGLPIVFHFQSREDPDKDITLEAKGKKASRMASPVIVKSLSYAKDVGAPMMLFLNAPHVWDSVSGGVGFGDGVSLPLNELNDAGKSAMVRPLALSGGAVTAREALANFVLGMKTWKPNEVRLP